MSIEDFINKYPQIPSEEAQLLRDAVAYWEGLNPGKTVTISVTETAKNGGATYSGGLPNMSMEVRTGSGGRVPVKTLDGRFTYVQYDNMVGPVHELGHAILDLLGIHTDDEELRIAVLAKAAKVAQGDMELLKRMLLGQEGNWSVSDQKRYAQEPNASYENMYNNSSPRNFSNLVGLSGNPDIQRRGYAQLDNWDNPNAWAGNFSGSNRSQHLIDGDNMALLGNQLANYIISSDGHDYIDGGDGNDELYGEGFEDSINGVDVFLEENLYEYSTGNDTIIGGLGKDYIHGGGGNDTLWADKKDQHSDTSEDELYGGDGKDIIHGSDGDNLIVGDNGDGSESSNSTNDNDTLYGYGGSDAIAAGNGDDTLYAGSDNVVDYLYGGKGNDTYYTSNYDVLFDEDGKGKIYFDNYLLSGEKTAVGDAGLLYEDGRFTYILENPNGIGDLTVAEGTNATGYTGRYIRITDFDASKQEYLGISFKDKKDIEIYVGDATATEGDDLVFDVGMAVSGTEQWLDEDLTLDVEVVFSSNADSDDVTQTTGQMVIEAGSPVGTFNLGTVDDDLPEDVEILSFAVVGVDTAGYTGNDLGNYFITNAGEGTITDNDGGNVHITISSDSVSEGSDVAFTNELTFTITASRELVDNESVTIDLSVIDIDTDWSDYAFLSDDTITLNASNQSQTVTLEITGDTENEPNETLEIQGTVVDSTDLQNVQIVSGTGTINDDDTGPTPYDDILILDDDANTMDALEGNDYVEGQGGNDMLTGNAGDDILWGGSGDDLLYGNSGSDILFGDTGADYLEGGTEDDLLYGGDGDDILLGGEGSDLLDGGSGFDYYIVDGGDSVSDSDGSGTVFFDGNDLSGSKLLVEGSSDVYEDSSFTFTKNGGLTVTSKGTGESITISSWNDGDLGIELIDSDQITVDVQDASALEAEEMMRIPVTLSRELIEGEKLVVDIGYYKNTYRSEPTGNMITFGPSPERRSYNAYSGSWSVIPAQPGGTRAETRLVFTGQSFIKIGTVTFEAGDQEKFFVRTWKDNDVVGIVPQTLTLTSKTNEDDSSYNNNMEVVPGRSGVSQVIDDDVSQRIDPLVLDLNKDGFISTTALDESETYFDLTGDGLRERVGWIGSEDAILAFDKNEDGQIDGINEVFGSQNESGFDELRRIADSNRDNVIDRKDELYNSLQVWQDYNQDGRVQEGELRGLIEAGISSIDLNVVETEIELNGNVLTEASKYTDVEGNKELVADIRLNADVKDTQINLEDIPDFTVDESTRLLPQLAGSGLVFDSFIIYNTNPEFKALAEAFSIDPIKLQKNFDAFMNQWSGYDAYMTELKEKYSLDADFKMHEFDRKAWIAERFLASDNFRTKIEDYYESALSSSTIPSRPETYDGELQERYRVLLEKAQSSFALLTFFQEELTGVSYELETDKFIVNDSDTFNTGLETFFNSDQKTTEEKLFLAKMIYQQGGAFNFDVNQFIDDLEDIVLKSIINDMFAGRKIVLGTLQNESIITSDDKQDIFLAGGDDTLQSGKGHDSIFFRRGDGRDVIQDAGGLDKLVFAQDIAKSDVLYRLNRNMDLVIAINEEGKRFEELSDRVTLVNWMKAENRIERIEFGDNQTLTLNEVLKLYEASDGTDNLGLSGGNDKFDAAGGNDVINAGAGNDQLRGGTGDDRLDGGSGNDIYLYGRGDGKDVITDSSGYDLLQFDDGIENEDLVAKFVGADLLIGIKEEGKTIDELSDVITLKNFKNTSSRIEEVFLDGYRRVNVEQLLNTPTENDDVIELLDSDNSIDLLAGNDTLIAGSGNDTIIGGKGADLLKGGKGDDIYTFNLGDGKDIIDDSSTFGYKGTRTEFAGNDTLQFGEGITQDDLIIEYFGSDLKIGIKEAGKTLDELSDVITIKNYTDVNSTIEQIVFADGSIVMIDPVTNGTAGNDYLEFIESTDGKVIEGLAGTDFIHTGSGADSIRAGKGNDNVYAGAGNDVLEGGENDDLLVGGAGNDAYIYNLGDGNDVILDDNRPEYENFGNRLLKLDNLLQRMEISDTEHQDGGYDTLTFGEGITLDDITHKINGNDLILDITDGGQVVIKNHLNSKNMIENIVLFDGTVLDFFRATPENDNLIFGDDGVSIDALDGDDVVSTGAGDDTLTGNLGNDTLKGGTGDDMYVFSRGDGNDNIQELSGQDALHFTGDITREQIEIRLIGRNLHVGIKEDGVAFDELHDKIVVINHTDAEQALELISFDNDSPITLGTYDFGTAEDDYFVFGNSDTLINAHGGDDTVLSGYGDDIITGGTGNDLLKGSAGNDTYVFSRGDGLDSIEDTLGKDTLRLTGGITPDELIIRLVGRDLVIGIKDGVNDFDTLTDKVTIFNHTNKNNQLEQIVFDDGTMLDVKDMDFSTFDDDYFVFGSANANIDALDGNDIIISDKGDDILIGNLGNDILKSGAGQDVLAGSVGTDRLEGGRENDTYLFSRGDGVDTIHDHYFGYSLGGGILEFDTDPSDGSLIIKVSDGAIDYLAGRERDFSDITGDQREYDVLALHSNSIFVKVLNDELVIARIADGKFENWSNAISFQKYVADDGTVSFGNGVVKGDMKVELVDGELLITHDGETLSFVSNANAGNDTLQFGEGITQDDILYQFSGNDLTLALKEDGKSFDELSDKVLIKDYILETSKIENIVFNDGSVFAFDGLPVATEDADHLIFVEGDITVDALGGDDKVTTASGNDSVSGGSGNDTLVSGAGRDVLTGGLGNDVLEGGLGNDSYIYNRLDGSDSIYDLAGKDVIQFGDGIVQSDLLFSQDGTDLKILLQDGVTPVGEITDSIVVRDWFKSANNIESLLFADGSSLQASDIAAMMFTSEADTLFSKHGAEMLGGKGDDTYVYKKDDFTVIINDQFYNEEIEINAGNDTLRFEDINRVDVTLGTKGDDLIIKIDADHDTYTELKDYVVIRDWKNPKRGIESIVFGNGEILFIDKAVDYPALAFDENWVTSRYYIYGSEDNVIEGSEFTEVIESGAGNDTIHALGGNDRIIAGTGNDTIDGGEGNDTYVFNIGDGTDTIVDSSGVDAIKFGSGIIRDDLVTEQVGDDLYIGIKEAGVAITDLADKLILSQWFNEESIEHRIELMVLDGEGTIAIADFIITPTENDDILEYGDEDNNIDALGGDDIINIGGGNDTLLGNDGNDTLYAEEGDDFISGDAGTDILYGADGDDTYRFGRGDGHDTIIEDNFTNWSQTGKDVLSFKDGITGDDLILVQEGADLVIGIKEDGKSFAELSDKVTIKQWALYDDENSRDASRAYYAVETFSFADGSSWSMAEIIANIGSVASETIIGFNQNDTLQGKEGDDVLLGHLGDDTYIFNRGDGKDVIYDYGRKGDDYSYYNAGVDTLKFGEGITEEDLIILRNENNVDIYIKEANKSAEELSDKIVIQDWFNANNRIERMILANGTEIDYLKYLFVDPSDGDDQLVYGREDDVVDALAGDDVVIDLGGDNVIDGNSGNDTIETGFGVDVLIGAEGDDILSAGSGDDTLDGGVGSDTYIFNVGDGHDTISDYSTEVTDVDKIVFGEGIDGNTLEFIRTNNDLTVTIDVDNSLFIQNWFLEENYRIESFEFADGSSLDADTIESLTLYYGDDNANEMFVGKNAEKVFALAGDDTIYGNIGNDVVTAGEGYDTLYGSEGNDTLYGNEGDDVLSGGTGNDELLGGSGNDQYIFGRGFQKDTIIDADGINSIVLEEGLSINDLYIKEEGERYLIALDEDGVAFDALSDVISIAKNEIDKIEFADGSSLYVSSIDLHTNVDDEITEGDGLKTIYEGSLNEDSSATEHQFSIIQDSITMDSSLVSEFTVELLDATSGAYAVNGNFDALPEGTEVEVSFKYEVHYDSEDLSLISGEKEITLTITGTNDSAEITGTLTADILEGASTQVSGQLNITDVDDGENRIQIQNNVAGTYGNFSINSNGAWTYNLTSDTLNEGESAEETFTVVSQDGTSQEDVVITVYGAKNTDTTSTGVPQDQQVNTYSQSYQENPVITALDDGGYVIAWESYAQDGSRRTGIYLQRYDSTGTRIGEEQSISADNNFTDNSDPLIVSLKDGGYLVAWEGYFEGQEVYLQQYNASGEMVSVERIVNDNVNYFNPSVAVLNDGSYVLAWNASTISDIPINSLYLQRYDSDGAALGAEEIIIRDTESDLFTPVLTALSDGGYVLSWIETVDLDGTAYLIYLEQYSNDGTLLGSRKEVGSFTYQSKDELVLTSLSDGGYVVAWQSNDQDGSGWGIFSQQFDSMGEQVGEEQQVNSYTLDDQDVPALTALSDGGYVISWASYNQDGSEYGVFLQQFSASGEKISGEQQVNTYSEASQDLPVITALNDGGYVVVWSSEDQDGSGNGVYLQQYNSAGDRVGIEKQVNSYTTDDQDSAVVTALNDGGFVIVWTSWGAQDGSETGIFLQQFNSFGEALFTGDVSGEVIYGGEGDDYLIGGAGADAIYDYYGGNDTLVGGAGNDYLAGGPGIDTYIYSRGDGQDVIYDEVVEYFQREEGDPQIIEFDSDISPEDITSLRDGDDIILFIANINGVTDFKDLIRIVDYYTIDNPYILSFSMGEYAMSITQVPLFADSLVIGTSGDDTLDGDEGNSSDILYGITGNDTLRGGYGNDIYVFNRGDGQDTIYDYGSMGAEPGEPGHYEDIIAFGEGININDISVVVDDIDLIITVGSGVVQGPSIQYAAAAVAVPESLDQITIKYGLYSDSTVETIQLFDGSVYNLADYFGIELRRGSFAAPIVLDMNGNGITSTALEDSNAYFDYNGDGYREHTGWVEKDDALLVADVNGDGIINDGSEHFGDFTKLPDGSLAKDGYDALQQYDTNGDRVLDNKDEAFGNLLLWTDANQNGKSEEGELLNIQLSTVTAIHLDRENGVSFEQYVENGNLVLNETNYTTLSGNGTIRDVGFNIDLFDAITDNDTLSVEFYGSTMSGEEGNDTYLFNLGDGAITVDDNGDGEDRLVFGEGIVKEQLLVKWDRNNDSLIIGVRDTIDDSSSITEVFNSITIENFFNEIGSIESFEFNDGTSINKQELYDILLQTGETRSLTARTLEEGSQLVGGSFSDLLYGAEGEDDLRGEAGNDFLRGRGGDDQLVGGEGNDVLEGGQGDDSLYGDNGDDAYIFNKGDGRDYIVDTFGNDTLIFGEGIKEEDLIFTDDGLNLIINFAYDVDAEVRDSIVIANYYLNGYGIEWAEFDDGNKLTLSTVINASPEVNPAEETLILQDIREQSGQIEASDVDGDTLSYSVTTAASNGTLTVDANGAWTYTVNDLYMGADSAIITIDDGNGGTVTKTLNFDTRITPPIVEDYVLNILEDGSLNAILPVENPSGSTLTYSVGTSPSNGVLTVDPLTGETSYTPNANYNGTDVLSIVVTNEYGQSSTSTITFEVEAVNDAPVVDEEIKAFTLLNTRDQAGQVIAGDVDGDSLTYSVTTQALHGIVLLDTKGYWHYRAYPSFNGEDTAVITIDDGNGGTVTQTLNFTVEGYVYEGQDLVIDDTSGDNTLVMGDLRKEDLTFTRNADHLVIQTKENTSITMVNFFTDVNAGVEVLELADGPLSLDREINVNAKTGFFGFTSGAEGTDNMKNLINGSNNYGDNLKGANLDDIIFGYDGSDDIRGYAGDDLLVGGNGHDNIWGGTGRDTLYGDNGNDDLYGEEDDDVLIGGAGWDYLYGGDGNDTLNGGESYDRLEGEGGDDTYVFNAGDGDDDIYDHKDSGWFGSEDAGDDTILFGESVNKENISFMMRYGDLEIQYGENDFVTVHNQDESKDKIERIELADGSYLTHSDIELIVQNINAYADDNGMWWSIDNDDVRGNDAMMQIISSAWKV